MCVKGAKIEVVAFDGDNKATLATSSDGSLTVDGKDGEAGLISGSKSLLFLFPKQRPAVVLSVELSDFDEGDFVLMEFSNDQSSQLQRKRAVVGTVTLEESFTDTSAGLFLFLIILSFLNFFELFGDLKNHRN